MILSYRARWYGNLDILNSKNLSTIADFRDRQGKSEEEQQQQEEEDPIIIEEDKTRSEIYNSKLSKKFKANNKLETVLSS